MRDAHLQEAIRIGGGVSRLAQALGLDVSTVSGWRRIPASHVAAITRLTGVEPHHLRPDVFPPDLWGGLAETQAPFSGEAAALGLDAAAIAAKAVAQAIQAEKSRRWLAENREAVEAWNRWTECNELPLAEYRMF